MCFTQGATAQHFLGPNIQCWALGIAANDLECGAQTARFCDVVAGQVKIAVCHARIVIPSPAFVANGKLAGASMRVVAGCVKDDFNDRLLNSGGLDVKSTHSKAGIFTDMQPLPQCQPWLDLR